MSAQAEAEADASAAEFRSATLRAAAGARSACESFAERDVIGLRCFVVVASARTILLALTLVPRLIPQRRWPKPQGEARSSPWRSSCMFAVAGVATSAGAVRFCQEAGAA